jgi:hypothetical protein
MAFDEIRQDVDVVMITMVIINVLSAKLPMIVVKIEIL